MLALRYHRQYLWVFFCMFFVLACVALFMDCYYVAAGGTGGGGGGGSGVAFQLRTPRFINVFCVFLFAAVSAVIHNSLSKSIVKRDILLGDRKLWYIKSIKVRSRRKKVKKVAKPMKYVSFVFASMMCNVISLTPLLILYGLWVGQVQGISDVTGTGAWSSWNNRSTLSPEFFIPAMFIKYLAWYVNGFCSYLGLFRKNPRRNILLAAPLNI